MARPFDVEQQLASSWPPQRWRDLTVLLAVSGGSDSVALLRAAISLKTGGDGRLVVAHFNHRLRPGQSDQDQQFVANLCGKFGIACEIGQMPQAAWEHATGDGIEAAARAARYTFLEQTAARLGARYVVTGHTADDQAETILHRILRGTGLAGLAGMRRARPLGPVTLLRPLLDFRRVALLEYLAQLGQDYRDDSSNHDPHFTRNRIRQQLLPELAAQFNPAVVDALLRLGLLAGEVQELVDQLVEDLWRGSVAESPSGWMEVRAIPLAGRQPYLVRQLLIAVWQRRQWPLQAMGLSQWNLLADMLFSIGKPAAATPRKQIFPGAIVAEVVGDTLRLTPPSMGCAGAIGDLGAAETA